VVLRLAYSERHRTRARKGGPARGTVLPALLLFCVAFFQVTTQHAQAQECCQCPDPSCGKPATPGTCHISCSLVAGAVCDNGPGLCVTVTPSETPTLTPTVTPSRTPTHTSTRTFTPTSTPTFRPAIDAVKC